MNHTDTLTPMVSLADMNIEERFAYLLDISNRCNEKLSYILTAIILTAIPTESPNADEPIGALKLSENLAESLTFLEKRITELAETIGHL